MFATFSRSWDIAKLSFRVMREDKELLLFPVFASVFSLLFILVMVFPVFVTALLPEETRALLQLPVLFIVYLGLSFIATFFSVCVVFTTKKRFEGGNATFSESLSFALSKVHLIIAWSLVSATVGIILRLIENAAERSRNDIVAMLGRVVSGILGLIWSVITVFVVPATVGIILRLIENAAERSRNDIVAMLGRVVSGILGLIWSVITVFVVPA